MPPRTLASLAHALAVAPNLDEALVALGEGLLEIDRTATVALLRYDERRELLSDRLTPSGGSISRVAVGTTFDHLPAEARRDVAAGGQFVDLADESQEYARLLDLRAVPDGLLSLRGLRFEGALCGVIALHETRKIFGTRSSERFAPAVALFELAYARFQERDARVEAVRTLEDVTQRVHAQYMRQLAELEQQLTQVRGEAQGGASASRVIALEREAAAATEAARRAAKRADAVEHQVQAAVGQLETAHVELHRRSETIRQKTRTLYLIDRALSLDAELDDPRQLVDALLDLVGKDMQAQRCSLMLRAPDPNFLYLAAATGIAPHVPEGYRVRIGDGVAGRVAQSRQPLLVQDVAEARAHPLLGDQYFTTGSFISFPLVYRDELVGVVNMTNRAQFGVFIDEDVERVRLLGLLISLIATQARLPERLVDTIGVG